MGKLKEVGVRLIKKVAKARKATPIEKQNLEERR